MVDRETRDAASGVDRRTFLRLAGAGTFGLTFLLSACAPAPQAQSTAAPPPPTAPPKPTAAPAAQPTSAAQPPTAVARPPTPVPAVQPTPAVLSKLQLP